MTEPANPSGLPIATTSWPTRSLAASPNGAAARPPLDVRTTARSESGSRPTTSKLELVAVDERGGSPLGAGDDVGVRDEEPVRRERDAGPCAAAPAPAAALDAEAGDRRDQPRRGRADGRRVGVERLLLDRVGDRLVGDGDPRSARISRSATIDQASPDASVAPPTLTVRSSSPRTIFSSIGRPVSARISGSASASVERPAGGLDEEVALTDPGAGGGAAVLDAADEQAVAIAQADRAAEPPGDVRRRDRDPEPRPARRDSPRPRASTRSRSAASAGRAR